MEIWDTLSHSSDQDWLQQRQVLLMVYTFDMKWRKYYCICDLFKIYFHNFKIHQNLIERFYKYSSRPFCVWMSVPQKVCIKLCPPPTSWLPYWEMVDLFGGRTSWEAFGTFGECLSKSFWTTIALIFSSLPNSGGEWPALLQCPTLVRNLKWWDNSILECELHFMIQCIPFCSSLFISGILL